MGWMHTYRLIVPLGTMVGQIYSYRCYSQGINDVPNIVNKGRNRTINR